ncbi:ATP-binding protein [Cystobacter fuscus]
MPSLSEPVYVDRSLWEMIVLNLVSNAFKFTFEGGITVRLREEERHVRLEVEDTGTGIPAHELPHVFERFHRVRDARARSIEGSGIGLALVRELVELHEGTISVESRWAGAPGSRCACPEARRICPRSGSRRSHGGPPPRRRPVTTSRRRSGGCPRAWRRRRSPRPPGSSPSPPPWEQPSSRVLIVDDNADMRDYLHRILAPHFEVQRAVDGLTALEAARARAGPHRQRRDDARPGWVGAAPAAARGAGAARHPRPPAVRPGRPRSRRERARCGSG